MVSLSGGQLHGRPARTALAILARRAAFAIAVAATAGVAEEDAPWIVECANDCHGENYCAEQCSGTESEERRCASTVPCARDCTPTPCTWDQWGAWEVERLTGLCNRSRTFTPNKCGGTPCVGRKVETKYCSEATGEAALECELADWGDWEGCQMETDQQDFGQRKRKRTVNSAPGVPCKGNLQMTAPCHGDAADLSTQDCILSDWLEWSGCSRSCDGGQKTRVRAVTQKALNGGKPCNESLTVVKPCGDKACPGPGGKIEDCKVSDWTDWSPCTGAERQKYRERVINSTAAYGGAGCNEALAEVQECNNTKEVPSGPVNCLLAEWQDWNLCDKTCDGGQTFRERRVAVAASGGGHGCVDVMKETKPCNENSCEEDPSVAGNCLLADWGAWSRCSTTCGQGLERRNRKIADEAKPGGLGCNAQLTEVRPCKSPKACPSQDCKWGKWSAWGNCSKACDTGFHIRARKIDVQATQGGEPCKVKGKTAEVGPCNTQKCENEVCHDGQWGAWQDWEPCSVSCDSGLRWRHRDVGVQASACGHKPTGPSTEYEKCTTDVPCEKDIDCELMPWSDWSPCTKTCEGLQHRERVVGTQRKGKGKTCDGKSLQEMRSCNGPTDQHAPEECGFGLDQDCVLDDWSDWSRCSLTCGEGQQVRTRKVEKEPKGEGKLCDGGIKGVRSCNLEPCFHKTDCVWSKWSPWGPCTHCDGTRSRWRHIQVYPQHGGGACDEGSSNMIEDCPEKCTYWCVWTEWSTPGKCSTTCGEGRRTRSRHLAKLKERPAAAKIVGTVTGPNATCEAKEHEFFRCPDQKSCDCIPINCSFSEWSAWGPPTPTGLCKRNRTVHMPANWCGKKCKGPLIQTKDCAKKGPDLPDPKQNCEFDDWQTWSGCGPHGAEGGQQYRHRNVKTLPGPLGNACKGPANETRPCEEEVVPIKACKWGEWEAWGNCTGINHGNCIGSHRNRTRSIASEASGGGTPCTGPLQMTEPCGNDPCPEKGLSDCQYSLWTEWQGCEEEGTGDGTHSQGYRERHIKHPGQNGGRPCRDPIQETGPCHKDVVSNCEWHWAEWGSCDKTCGGGMKFRTREKARPWHGGKPCGGKTHESETCSDVPCDTEKDCKFEAWKPWSTCSSNCTQTRERGIAQYAKEGGQGCNDKMEQVRPCSDGECPAKKDCKWGNWEDWGDCVFAEICGWGSRTRTRKVVQPPASGGKPCDPRVRMEVTPTGKCTKSCDPKCTPSAWMDWTPWGTCSVSCGRGGTRSRQRLVKQQVNPCDLAPKGLAQEFEGCDAGIPCVPSPNDCEFEPWTQWSPCSATCNGVRKQSRKAARYAKPGGTPCEGEIERIEHCNPADGKAAPFGCAAGTGALVDCVLTDWQAWSPCTVTCDVLGQKTRERRVATPPKHGGKACESTLKELASCGSTAPCPSGGGDCWGDWQEWTTECFQGELKRIRVPRRKGGTCLGPSDEVEACAACPVKKHTCAWSDWSAWSDCTCTSKGSRTTRQRNLTTTPITATQAKFSLDMVSARLAAAHPDAASQQELVAAFAGGFVSLLAALSLGRVASHALTSRESRPSAGVAVDDDRGLNSATQPLAPEARAEDIEGQ